MALEIIGAGFGRTGTYSLKAALERLGFGPCHHMSEVINDPEQVTLWAEVAGGRPDFERSSRDFSLRRRLPRVGLLAGRPRRHPRREGHPVRPGSRGLVRELLANHPAPYPRQGRLADNRRAWFEMIDKVIIGKALGGRTDREGILAAYRANTKAAQALEAEGRALVFRSRDGWGPLCDFLGVEVPDEPYPKTNPRAEFLPR